MLHSFDTLMSTIRLLLYHASTFALQLSLSIHIRSWFDNMGWMLQLVKYGFIVFVSLLAIQVLPQFFGDQVPPHIGGHVNEGLEPVLNAFRENFQAGWERQGAAFAVYHKGRSIVDLWGGYADREAAKLWQKDTLTVVMSITKAVSALCAAMLADQGHLDYDALVTKYWPEFGQQGKENVTVKQLLAHQSGLAATDQPISVEAVADWRLLSRVFEEQAPFWPPGTAFGYHVFTFGWLVGTLVRRVDPKGRSMGQFFAEEIALKHDIDFYIGLPMEEFHRTSRLHKPVYLESWWQLLDWSFVERIVTFVWDMQFNVFVRKVLENLHWVLDPQMRYLTGNNPYYLNMEIPSSHGVGNARALAKLFGLVLEGKILRNSSLLQQIATPYHFEEHVPSVYMKGAIPSMGYGFIHRKTTEGDYVFGHSGYGGQNLLVDKNHDIVLAYVTNGLGPDMGHRSLRFRRLYAAVRASLATRNEYSYDRQLA